MIIIGDGGHSKVIQEMIFAKGEYKVLAVLDDKYEQGFQLNGIIHAPISFLYKLSRNDTKVVVAIGNNNVRKVLVERLSLLPEKFLTVIHPTAVVSPSSRIGYGTVIMPQTIVNANAEVGIHCILNTASIVEHDNKIGNYVHISPNATLAGNVSVGDGAHIGSSATVIPGKHVGNWSIVGAGSTVIEHIPGFSKAVGSPTRIIERMLLSNSTIVE